MNILTIYCAVVITFKSIACFRVEILNISNEKIVNIIIKTNHHNYTFRLDMFSSGCLYKT